jgi:hypothetical protein
MVIPVLMLSFIKNAWLGFVLNVSTVLCFTGLHEVAREIESPFQNVPNDVPLNNFQAQFNEGLMVMFYGYHPDAYWDVDETMKEIRDEYTSAIGGGAGGGAGANNHWTNDRSTNSANTSRAMEDSCKTTSSNTRRVGKPALTSFNPGTCATTGSLALPLESESITDSLDTKPTVSFTSSEERHFLGKLKRHSVTKIRVDDEHVGDYDDEIPAIEAFMASLSQSGSFRSNSSSPPPPPSATAMQRNEVITDFATAVTTVDEEREEYDNLCGIVRTLSADQKDLLQAKERQQQLVEAQQLQQHQRQKDMHQREKSSLSLGSNTSKPPQISFLIPNTEGEDSSVVFVNDGGRDMDDGSINTYENDENERYIL